MAAVLATDEELRALVVVRLGLVEDPDFEKLRATAARLRIPLDRALGERGVIPTSFLLQELAQQWDVGFIDLEVADVRPEALRAIPEEYARGRLVVPFDAKGGELRLAMQNPRDKKVIAEIEQLTRLTVKPFLAPELAIRRAHLLYRGNLRELLERTVAEVAAPATRTAASDRSAAELLSRILDYAVVARASDVHIEPYEVETLVRCRVDGVLREVLSVPPVAHASLVARVKILASMRIDERRVPQDGRLEVDLGGLRMDIRVSSIPTPFGEKLVMRLLPKEAAFVDLEHLGLSATDFDTLRINLLRPFGMILVTGPTGSGKSTSLYAMLMRLGIERHNALNISTIEDPIEYSMPRVSQMAVNSGAGLEFADGLRALLRQDPDVIMVGEIRDRETASTAIESSLTGHLILSSLHTNDAASAVTRLVEMGIEPFLVASSITCVVAQRRARALCDACKEPVTISAELMRENGFEATADIEAFGPVGCVRCGSTGYRGRIGMFEVMRMSQPIRELVLSRAAAETIAQAAGSEGMRRLHLDGLDKVKAGQTSFAEVLRVTSAG